ncbi:hypothetical protein OTK49_02470 [Vibrio coralliirubri]|uniref:hypothetical protein n=1 Tax=Vibrio coralliirubri TaxID=1516159 RepID=UPI00228355C1|nr:hypothetical protein [Vibrio coralliirubri]MCY9861381.1 hypothetical protein [Vibrio coralliirubri]
MSPSKQRYKEAVNAAREHAYSGKKSNPPKHFDERQQRIYAEKYGMFNGKCAYVESLLDDMALLHGYKYTEDKTLVKIA